MKFCLMQLYVPLLVLPLFCGLFSFAVGQEQDSKGKQVLKSLELPANVSIWPERIRGLSVSTPGDAVRKEPLDYWFFFPSSDQGKSEQGYPLLLFLHGAGERGDDPKKVTVHGPPKIVGTDAAADWPFITVSPQCPAGKYWSPAILFLLLDEIEKEYPVDKDRVYVTGLSMGGFGTWMLLNEAPKRFAAAAPICGGGNTDWAPTLKDIPIWVFHGGADAVVKPQLSTDLVEAIKIAGGEKIKLTIYPEVGHNSWDNAYSDQDLWKWFLEHKREK